MAGRNLPSVSAQQQILGDIVPRGTAGHGQGAYSHDFDNVPMGCMRQVCSAGYAARARRNKKSEREQREEDIVADFRHEKERLVAEVRLKELIVQQKELSIQELDVRIRTMDLEHSIQNRTMEREHQSELVSRDHSEAILLGDLREFCQFNDEEVEELRKAIDLQGKRTPPFLYDIVTDPYCSTPSCLRSDRHPGQCQQRNGHRNSKRHNNPLLSKSITPSSNSRIPRPP